MTWTFKDRYNSSRLVTIDDEFLNFLKYLEETFESFRDYNNLSTIEQNALISEKGEIFAKVIFIHTQISYCLGTHGCKDSFHYDYYCKTVRKNLINVHPMFAIKKYAEYVSLIRNDNEILKIDILKKPLKNQIMTFEYKRQFTKYIHIFQY